MMSCKPKVTKRKRICKPCARITSDGANEPSEQVSLSELQRLLQGTTEATVYTYVVDTLQIRNQHFEQTGCGPNVHGGMISLCTCKHLMRTGMDAAAWRGFWVAGFSGFAKSPCGNLLYYLMKVGPTFSSHAEAWRSGVIPRATKRAKSVRHNVLGDMYEPKPGFNDPMLASSYHPPCKGHAHDTGWHDDVCYVANGRPAALLFGEPGHSWHWTEPTIRLAPKLPRNSKKYGLGELLSLLRDMKA